MYGVVLMHDKAVLMRGFEMGPWTVLPDRGLLRGGEEEKHLEPLVMEVLVALAVRQGEVVSNDQLADAAWGGRAVMDDPIIRCISLLRRELGDNARAPDYIENIPRRGYRLKMPITVPESELESTDSPIHPPRPAYYLPLLAGFAAVVVIAIIALLRSGPEVVNGEIMSLAVFPLECAEDDKIVCYSVTEELIGKLLQAKDVDKNIKVVRSREPYPAGGLPGEGSQSLDVDGVFIGSLSRTGEDIHIYAEILNAQNESIFWSDTYDGKRSDVIDIRADLADDVVAGLLGEGAKSLTANSRPQSFEALDTYTTGQHEFAKRSADGIREAIKLFAKTIDLDPNFGPAYVRLAYAYALLPEYSTASRTLMYEKAIMTANKGVAIDPSIAGPAETVYGFIKHKRGQWTSAEQSHLTAINSSTVYPISHQLYSRLLASVGRLEESLEHAQKAREIDPQQAVLISRVAVAYLWLDDLENAQLYFERSAARTEYQSSSHDLAYALFLIRKGEYSKAEREAIRGLEKNGQDASWVPTVFEGIHNPDKYDEAHDIVERIAASGKMNPGVEITLWALLKDGDRAMEVARGLKEGEIFEAEIMFTPTYSVLREHPDFPELLDAIGLTEYWKNAGCSWDGSRVSC